MFLNDYSTAGKSQPSYPIAMSCKEQWHSFLISKGPSGRHICDTLSSMAVQVAPLGSEEKKFAERLIEAFQDAEMSVGASLLSRLLRDISTLGIVPRPAVQQALLVHLKHRLCRSAALEPFEQDNVLKTCSEWGVQPSNNLQIALGLRPHREAPKVETLKRRRKRSRSRLRSPAGGREGAERSGVGKGGGAKEVEDTGRGRREHRSERVGSMGGGETGEHLRRKPRVRERGGERDHRADAQRGGERGHRADQRPGERGAAREQPAKVGRRLQWNVSGERWGYMGKEEGGGGRRRVEGGERARSPRHRKAEDNWCRTSPTSPAMSATSATPDPPPRTPHKPPPLEVPMESGLFTRALLPIESEIGWRCPSSLVLSEYTCPWSLQVNSLNLESLSLFLDLMCHSLQFG